ncbi:MAG: leucine-rich repeat domain-containing protein [Planctomycetia bacterium]|nr:leucine-rich repeat domain-containing protein [Planctomycetia bacterium]
MGAWILRRTHSEVRTIVVFSWALLAIPVTDARAITFGEWATNQGWPADYEMPAKVEADSASIDSLAGIGNFDWMATPTTALYLNGNQITSLESGAFTGLGNLRRLYLKNNQISSIESRDFTGLDNLTILDLDYNQITNLEPGAFAELSNLTNLDLGHNEIRSLGSGTFTGLGHLISLSLWNNQITSLESGAFAGLGNLTGLDLGHNQITSIGSAAFTGLGSLTALELRENQITSIDSGDFAGLSNLTTLNLLYNRITSLESGAFSGLGSLTTLRMYHNQITSIKSGAFNGLGDLTTLELDGNQVTSLESGIFTGLDHLTLLNLCYNHITSLESGVFSGLGNLTTLSLHHNRTLTNLNLEGADFTSLNRFLVTSDTLVSRVSLRNTRLNQTSLAALINGSYREWDIGIGELPGVTELDLSGVDFAAITDLSPLYVMDDLTDFWLVDVENMDANALDVLLDNLATMQDPGIEGTLYLTQADYDAFNTAGGGKLAIWDAEPGHHVQIVPEPSSLVLLAGIAVMGIICLRRRKA